MISTNIDLGQLIIGGLIATVTYLFKRAVDDFNDHLDKLEIRLDKHDDILANLTGSFAKLSGILEVNNTNALRRNR